MGIHNGRYPYVRPKRDEHITATFIFGNKEYYLLDKPSYGLVSSQRIVMFIGTDVRISTLI
jgi:hypothetical protein